MNLFITADVAEVTTHKLSNLSMTITSEQAQDDTKRFSYADLLRMAKDLNKVDDQEDVLRDLDAFDETQG